MPLKSYIKDAPQPLKDKIDVPDFYDDETSSQIWVQAQKWQKLQVLQNWVGCSLMDDPISFLGDLLEKFGLHGFQLKTRKKWQGKDGMLLYLRVFKARYETKQKYPDNYIGYEKALMRVHEKYYSSIDLKSLKARYYEIENKNAPSINNVICYLNSKNKTDEEKISFINTLEKALSNTCQK